MRNLDDYVRICELGMECLSALEFRENRFVKLFYYVCSVFVRDVKIIPWGLNYVTRRA